MSQVLAVDLGGTRLRVARLDADGRVVAREVVRTPIESDRPQALVDVCRTLGSGVDAAVIGVPGRVDHARGALEHAPNLPSAWLPHLSQAALTEAVGVPVYLGNDADLAAVGEWGFGAGRGSLDMLYVTVSTGVGGGVILGGQLARGRRSIGEIGHVVIDRAARRAGQRCTVEQLGSGSALDRHAKNAGWPDGSAVIEAAANGHASAQHDLDDVLDAVSLGVVNAAFAFSPEVVVVGGGLGLQPVVRDAIARRLAVEGPPGWTEPIRVVAAELGDDAGLIGAAAWLRATRGQV